MFYPTGRVSQMFISLCEVAVGGVRQRGLLFLLESVPSMVFTVWHHRRRSEEIVYVITSWSVITVGDVV